MNLPSCVGPGKIAFTDGVNQPRREIRINREIVTLSKGSFPVRIPNEITLMIGGDRY
jgi:hypothetical protein